MVIDSHVHLYSKENALDLSWMTPDFPFNSDHNLDNYLQNSITDGSLEGLVFIEVDVKNEDLSIPIKEYSYVVDQYEMNDPRDLKFKKIIAYCPLLASPQVFAKYIQDLQKVKGAALFKKYLSGFRYLLQDKPKGTMANLNLIENLKYLGSNNYVFDLGIDLHNGGIWQFDEFLELLSHFNRDNCPRFILNHLTKPDLTLDPTTIQTNPLFVTWCDKVSLIHDTLVTLQKPSYMKLSGVFSELSSQVVLSQDRPFIRSYINPWLTRAFEIWGPDYLIWGSDFPVSQFQFAEEKDYTFVIPMWKQISDELLSQDLKLDNPKIEKIYSQNTIDAYTF